jgi:hypothetical protein
MNEFNKELASRIKEISSRMDWSNGMIGRVIGVSDGTIGNLLAGKNLNSKNITAIAVFLSRYSRVPESNKVNFLIDELAKAGDCRPKHNIDRITSKMNAITEQSGVLPTVLARLCNMSDSTMHKVLRGEGISESSMAKVISFLDKYDSIPQGEKNQFLIDEISKTTKSKADTKPIPYSNPIKAPPSSESDFFADDPYLYNSVQYCEEQRY